MPQRPPPPGQIVDIRPEGSAGPRRLHLWRQGTGRPAAVLDTGLGGNALVWAVTLPVVAQVTEAIAYDRRGSGWSDPAPAGQPRTSQRIVEELRLALGTAGLTPPYVLVGHSAGAIHMLVYARQHPREVAGLVLVDPSHPEMFVRAPGVPGPRSMAALYGGLARLRPLVGTAFLNLLIPKGERLFPPEAWAGLRYFAAHGGDYAAAAREAAASAESFEQARGGPGSLGDLPLIVLTAEWWVTGKPTAMKRAFVPLREELARYSTRGQHRIVKGCDHTNLPFVRPDAVAEAVRDVVGDGRRG